MLYPKINGVYKRDHTTNKFIAGQFATPEFDMLKFYKWQATEKIDGTNIRIYVDENLNITVKGRTDKAALPPALLDHIDTLDFTHCEGLVLYGEGYGGKIQHGAGYGDTEKFILFDVLTPAHRFLDMDELIKLHYDTKIPLVHSYQPMTLVEWIAKFAHHRFPLSDIRSGYAEGVVLTVENGLCDKYGKRITTKLKVKDFQ